MAGIVFVILGAAVALDQMLGLLAGVHSGAAGHAGNPAAALFVPLMMVLVGIKWRRDP